MVPLFLFGRRPALIVAHRRALDTRDRDKRVGKNMVRQRDRTGTKQVRYSFLRSGAGLARKAAAVPA